MAVFLTLLFAFGILGSANPPAPSTKNHNSLQGGFSLSQVPSPAYERRPGSGALAIAKALSKFGAPLSPDLQNTVRRLRLEKRSRYRRSTGSVVTKPQLYDVEFLTPVTVGTPSQSLHLDLDSGSSDMWVFSSESPRSQVNGQAVYDPSKSSTAKKMPGAEWRIAYGDGSSCSGDVWTDKVSVGGVSVVAQAVECATEISGEFTNDAGTDGLLGMGFDSINSVSPVQQKTWFSNIKGGLDAPVWTANLMHGKAGTYDFGFVNHTLHTSDLIYTPVDSSDGYWQFRASGYALAPSAPFVSQSIVGIADTGTTLLMLSDEIVNAYYATVSGAVSVSSEGGYIFDCSIVPPDLIFGVEGARFTIPGKYISYSPATAEGKCFGGLQSDAGIGFGIFGDIALKAAFVVFDAEKMRLGWAKKNLS